MSIPGAAILAAAALTAAAPPPLAQIVAGKSASLVLGAWCANHRLPPLRADRLTSGVAPSSRILVALGSPIVRRIAHRRVRLACGARTLLVADNWYLPDRLTPDMNRRLETSSAPFGLVVRPLGFRRQTLSATTDRQGRLTMRAVLIDRRGARFSYVSERYAILPR